MNKGKVVSVRGSVVDITCPEQLPSLHSELRAGEQGEIVVETISHLDAQTVRGLSLTPTQGLARGSSATDTDHPLRVPVGNVLKGRVLHQQSPPLFQQATSQEMLETGIKCKRKK